MVAISGTHGKTTTTSLLTVGAQACGVDPSFAIGGNLYETGMNAHLGTGDLAIVEADESDGSFLLTRPAAAIVTNVEADHLENHGDLEGIFRAFELFVDRDRRTTGCCCAAPTTPGRRRIAEYARAAGRRVLTYGEAPDADVQVSDIAERPDGVEFTVQLAAARARCRVSVGSLIGRHMALNATAALAVAAELGLDVDTVLACVARRFGGVHRRFESHGEAAECGSTTTTPTTRPRSRPRSRRHGPSRRRSADRGVPARHVQPHADLRRRVRRRDGDRRHRGRDGHLPGARGADPGRHRRARSAT